MIKVSIKEAENLSSHIAIGRGEKGETGDVTPEALAALNQAKAAASAAEEYAGEVRLAKEAASTAEKAASHAAAIANEVQTKLAAGEFTGAMGPQGPKGEKGNTASITVGQVKTGDAGSLANVTSSGDTSCVVLDFTIPQGIKGEKGDTGPKGDTPALANNLTTIVAGKALDASQGNLLSSRIGNLASLKTQNKSSVTSSINEVYDNLTHKQDTISGAASSILSSDLETQRVLVSNTSGKVSHSTTTSTELSYLNGVTANIQDQINQLNIDDLEIGGRNLLINSENLLFKNYGGTSSTTEENIAVTEWGTTNAIRVYGTSGTNTIAMLIVSNAAFLPNQNYIGSIYIKNNHISTNMIFRRVTAQGYETVLPGESKRVSFLYNPKEQKNQIMQIHAVCAIGSEFDFTYWRPQWEKGNKITDWTPAPEDVINKFNAAYLLDRINPITSGSLNDYITPGIYTCTNSTIANEITDQPDNHPKAGYKIIVEYVGHSTMVLQTLIYQASMLYTYKRLRDNGTWKSWYGGPSNQWNAIGQLADLQTAEKGSLVCAINSLNNDSETRSKDGKNCTIYYNSTVVFLGIQASGLTLDPNVTDTTTFTLPVGFSISGPVHVVTCALSSSWRPTTNNVYVYVDADKQTINVRCAQAATGAVIASRVAIPRSFLSIK